MKESKLFENLKQFRDTVFTGIEVIDALTHGGIDKNEICIISTPTNLISDCLKLRVNNSSSHFFLHQTNFLILII